MPLENYESRPGQEAASKNDTDKAGSEYNAKASSASDATADWLRRDMLRELAELMISLAESLRIAAARGSDATCHATLKQLRLTLIEAIDVHKSLGPRQSDAANGGAE